VAVPLFRISEVAALAGVSDDTVRRWADSGRLPVRRDPAGRLAVDGEVLASFLEHLAVRPDASSPGGGPVVGGSARNRFPGLVTRVDRDGLMAKVEIQAGPHRVVSVITREAADELGLEPGVLAVAAVKATSVTIELPQSGA
jgi:molybdopterin-binding protein